MVHFQKVSILQVLLDIFRAWNWFFGIFIIAVCGIFIALWLSSKILATFLLFMLLGVITRYPAARSPYDLSLIKPLTILLCVFDFRVAAFYALATWWVARFWNPVEEMTYTIAESISITATALTSPLLFALAHNNLITFTLYFLLVHFILSACVLTPIQRPASLVSDFVFNVTEFMFTIFYNSLLILVLAGPFLNFFGIENWNVGAFSQITSIFTRNSS